MTVAVIGVLVSGGPLFAADEPPMDHAAMAQSYEAEATQAQQKAASHEQELKRYQNLGVPKGSATTAQGMVMHCQKLADAYKSAATESSALATAHREMAAASK